MELLRKSNEVAARYDQPLLYQDGTMATVAPTAFHVSIAWTFARPGQDLHRATTLANDDMVGRSALDEVMGWRIVVDSVKVKIGNVVTSVALSGQVPGHDKTRFLFDEA